MPWWRRLAAVFLVLAIALSPLRAVAATVSMLVASVADTARLCSARQ